MRVRESTIEQELIEKLDELKYTLRKSLGQGLRARAHICRHLVIA
ncbi:hypothetical protein [Dokdonella sp.]